MKNINNCAKIASLNLVVSDVGTFCPYIKESDSGYVGCLEFDSLEELQRTIKTLQLLLKMWKVKKEKDYENKN